MNKGKKTTKTHIKRGLATWKIVIALVDRNTGQLISANGFVNGMYPSQRILLAIGARGSEQKIVSGHGIVPEWRNHIAFYDIVPEGEAVFRYKEDLDSIRTQKAEKRCAINWINGFLRDADAKEGEYYLRSDQVNPDPKEEETGRVQYDVPMPSKDELAMERGKEACVQMVRVFVEHKEGEDESEGRKIKPFIRRIFFSTNRETPSNTHLFKRIIYPSNYFREFARARLLGGMRGLLNKPLRDHFTAVLNEADAIWGREKFELDDARESCERACHPPRNTEDKGGSLVQMIEEHLARLAQQPQRDKTYAQKSLDDARVSLESCVDAVRTYFFHRKTDDADWLKVVEQERAEKAPVFTGPPVHLLMASREPWDVPNDQPNVYVAPMFTSVLGPPIQVVRKFPFSGFFPKTADEIFSPRR